ncbi:MAG: 30S ribosomal protein S1 [Marinilabiliaceae bacterium]|nr:30S ribosomal protein S1 [Marinilabiliaceae bacterium]
MTELESDMQEQESDSHINQETNIPEDTHIPEEMNILEPVTPLDIHGDVEVINIPHQTADPDFDWEKYESEEVTGVEERRDELEKIYNKTLSTITEKEVIDGTVISITKREVVINIGFKSDGIVSRNEFRYNPDLKVGDIVEIYVDSQEDKKGQLVLSHKNARALRSWDRVNQALESGEIIKGFIKCRTKGGMIVDVFGIEAFLPGSQIDVKPIRDYDLYVGKTMEFKVVKINHEFKNVVVSHKALIEAELELQKKEIISKLEKGQVLEGIVKNITTYGVFIDLGGVDGLIHITDLSWGRVNHPEEIVQLDSKINVVILDFDDEKKRIALGLKQLTPHPWEALDPNLKIGDIIKGKVVVLADYGAFVEITTGVEGLIHVSEMTWSQHLRSAQDFLSVGDEIEAVILTLDRTERKMSMGIKQLKPDPWVGIDEKYIVGSKHAAKVRNFTSFGVFVEIEEGIDGLIHISDLSWTRKIKHPAEFISIDDSIEVVVLEIDKENRRLSLGHKQLEENPWDVFETIFIIDTIHEGTIVEVFEKGALVALQYGVEGFATTRHLYKEDGNLAQLDEKLLFKIIDFNKVSKRIILSHSRIFEDKRKAEEETIAAEIEAFDQEVIKEIENIIEEVKEVENITEEVKEVENITEEVKEVENITEEVKEVENITEEVKEVETVTEEVKEVENITEEVKEVETVTEEVNEVENITEEVKDTETITEEVKEVENITEEVKDTETITEEVNEVENITEEVNEVENITEEVKEVENITEEVNEVENITEEVKEVENITEEVNEVENITEEVKEVENITEEINEVENITEEVNEVENITEEVNEVENITEDVNEVETTSDDQNEVETATDSPQENSEADSNELFPEHTKE